MRRDPDCRTLVEKVGLCFDVNVETCTIQGSSATYELLLFSAGLKSVMSFPVTVALSVERCEDRGSSFSTGLLRSPHRQDFFKGTSARAGLWLARLYFTSLFMLAEGICLLEAYAGLHAIRISALQPSLENNKIVSACVEQANTALKFPSFGSEQCFPETQPGKCASAWQPRCGKTEGQRVQGILRHRTLLFSCTALRDTFLRVGKTTGHHAPEQEAD
ncbi:hypothetical protein Baya_12064 [Bagarius yarrelli]|uniref:Uncharacterized protein n=1 Tax=Bagarius yarrelli TaxID=175774 RepID=A0A556V2V6_BAGYA|nr:hypothetical protein Baya_12064 [Bagarius yarrelli]